ncbi:peptidase C60 sortase A and B [Cellulomonas fimi ATCC 484]|uniref:Peptidase C60 sortase A and B n=1 Tax=Cellulomonas fimi (strain ATCC 484 / DSM 20113 / JCM 1341 / CCUG 24087 / LMG 16345 / NBRC 15513 / NCIMB 8980 / NCTC 7547 / NRS-133) TaxID=590998 RepID=F4H1Q4_CELFA|nr:peptidase C60 sortase A and B [Cellulomonas fimi ATCC 484]VEH36315.1 Sortase family [Cellulomonas fimi]
MLGPVRTVPRVTTTAVTRGTTHSRGASCSAGRPGAGARRRPWRTTGAALAVLAVLVAGACSPGNGADAAPTASSRPGTPAPRPTPSTTPPPATVPEVPVRDASLAALEAPDAPPAPVRVTVPSVGVDLPVEPVGVDADGTMALPASADVAGWYQFGPAPASPAGSTLVAAHVDARSTGVGPFSRLRDVAVGAQVDVVQADGTTTAYRVLDVVRIAKEEAPVDTWFDRDGPRRLVLVTCGGAFRRDVGHYADNVVVTAEPIGG